MRKLIAAFVFGLLWVAAPGHSLAQGGQWWWCTEASHKTPRLYYFSDTFGPAQALMTKGGDTLELWRAQFSDYVFHTYGEKGSAGCGGYFNSASDAESHRKQGEQQIANAQNKGKVINTGWQPSPLQPVQ